MSSSNVIRKQRGLLVLFTAILTAGQTTPPKSAFWDRARIERSEGHISIRASSPRPLEQTIEAFQGEFGWNVDYEEPPFESYDLVDSTDPNWRKANPTARGVRGLAGGLFQTSFSLGTDMNPGSLDEERILNKVIADYHAGGNPGGFELRKENADRYSIVGVAVKDADGKSKATIPIMDSRVRLPAKEYTLGEALNLLMRALSEKTGCKVDLGYAPTNLIAQSKVVIGGEERTAREFVTQLATEGRSTMVWRLLYDADWGGYFLGLEIATPKERRSSRHSSTIPVPTLARAHAPLPRLLQKTAR